MTPCMTQWMSTSSCFALRMHAYLPSDTCTPYMVLVGGFADGCV
jgi:hypothetical protein